MSRATKQPHATKQPQSHRPAGCHHTAPLVLHTSSLRATTIYSITIAEVCQVLRQFYDDRDAQHLKQDWLVKPLKISEARHHDADYLA